MSWLTEWVRGLMGWKKGTPEVFQSKVIQCHRLEATRVLVMGGDVEGQTGCVEISVNKKGFAALVMSNGVDIGNAVCITRKPTGEVNFDFIGPDKAVKIAMDMAPDGTIMSRWPSKPDTPPGPGPEPPPEPPTPTPVEQDVEAALTTEPVPPPPDLTPQRGRPPKKGKA